MPSCMLVPQASNTSAQLRDIRMLAEMLSNLTSSPRTHPHRQFLLRNGSGRSIMAKAKKSRTIAVRLISMALTGYFKTFTRPRKARPLSLLRYDPVEESPLSRAETGEVKTRIQPASEKCIYRNEPTNSRPYQCTSTTTLRISTGIEPPNPTDNTHITRSEHMYISHTIYHTTTPRPTETFNEREIVQETRRGSRSIVLYSYLFSFSYKICIDPAF
ncbi:hypothetical protein EJ05DRAFT_276621 [Pseudovirgaria hyperparasitica]|uniref:Ribosomal protein L33 n=1 Tax=Pseudovirgaria hyperparasitica TaxID=470096 RepID=A0A6A6WF80_9PEZI|nr:uncharacterized protein EJ05DRAFT_276621 [Pseudovirgaria hyperparasitica]KAF2760237.1 hypothetical protein EJ05DRAFT_276621 [Pseudovirgaria hyperparasitica]